MLQASKQIKIRGGKSLNTHSVGAKETHDGTNYFSLHYKAKKGNNVASNTSCT